MNLSAYGLLFLTSLLWGGNSVAGKLAMGHVSPMLLTSSRLGLALIVLVVIGRHHLKREREAVRANLPLLFTLGLFGFTLFNVALYSALLFTSAVNTSIEQAAIPMLIFIGNFLLFGQRVAWGQIAGFSLSVLGVVLTAAHGEPARLLALDVNRGDAIMLVALLVYAAYTVMLRKRPPLHWLSLMTALTGLAFLSSLPFVFAEWAWGALLWPDAQGWAVILYAGLLPSLVAQVFYIRGVELIGANRAGLFINLVPICGTLLAVAVLGEQVFAYHAAALALVLAGIALAEWSGRRLG
ncbi:MAG: EamA family transporter [Mesorhizobium amorphae]|nr:MAG: EamA family transporter [Mesorhizobium amorphae]